MAQHLTRRQLARAAVGPAWGGEADLPARPPGQVMQRVRVGPHDQVARAGADAELRVVADRRIGWVERGKKVSHHGAMPERRLKRGWAKRLATDRPVDVGHAEEDE